MKYFPIFISLILLVSCSSEPDLIKQGELLFNKTHLGKNKVMGCVSCHSIKPNINTVGPSLNGLQERAENLISNLSAKEYIKQSIINPNAYIVNGYLPSVMYSHYADKLSKNEIAALVMYLSSL